MEIKFVNIIDEKVIYKKKTILYSGFHIKNGHWHLERQNKCYCHYFLFFLFYCYIFLILLLVQAEIALFCLEPVRNDLSIGCSLIESILTYMKKLMS